MAILKHLSVHNKYYQDAVTNFMFQHDNHARPIYNEQHSMILRENYLIDAINTGVWSYSTDCQLANQRWKKNREEREVKSHHFIISFPKEDRDEHDLTLEKAQELGMDDDVQAFLQSIRGDPYERLFILDLFSGLRQSELLGLQWDDVDFEVGTLTVRHQLQRDRKKGGNYIFLDETKNRKTRQVSLAPSVMEVLRKQRAWQNRCRIKAGQEWDNPHNLVFTNEQGGHLAHMTVYKHFKKAAARIGMTQTRFHDLRHSYAVNALQAGDNAKIVSEQLGHYSAAFTLDTYAAVSKTMRKESQDHMEQLFQSVTGLA